MRNGGRGLHRLRCGRDETVGAAGTQIDFIQKAGAGIVTERTIVGTPAVAGDLIVGVVSESSREPGGVSDASQLRDAAVRLSQGDRVAARLGDGSHEAAAVVGKVRGSPVAGHYLR